MQKPYSVKNFPGYPYSASGATRATPRNVGASPEISLVMLRGPGVTGKPSGPTGHRHFINEIIKVPGKKIKYLYNIREKRINRNQENKLGFGGWGWVDDNSVISDF